MEGRYFVVKKSVNIDIQAGVRVLTKHFSNVYDLKENESSQHVFYYDERNNKCEAIFRQEKIIGVYILSNDLLKPEETVGEDLQIKLDEHGKTIEELQEYLHELISRLRKLEINKETGAKSVFTEIKKEDPKEEDPDYTSDDNV